MTEGSAGGGVLVLGATGILRPAAERLHERGRAVTGIARRATEVPFELLTADAGSADELAALLAGRRFDGALVYSPTVVPETLRLVGEHVDGPVILVRVSSFADPSLGDFQLPEHTLQLGWHREPDGGTRWHSPAEVSEAALEVLADGRSRVLGVMSPWSERP